jgi:hypothetical protein
MLSFKSSKLGPPTPSLPGSVALLLPPLGLSERHTCLRGRGWGDPIPTKGQTLWFYNFFTVIVSQSLRYHLVAENQITQVCVWWGGGRGGGVVIII